MKSITGRAALGTVVAAIIATMFSGPAQPAAAAGSQPPLKLEAARSTVTVETYDGVADLDLGVYAIAGAQPFEIRAFRTSYSQKLTAFRIRNGADQLLPTGTVREDFAGLSAFTTLKVVNAAKKVVVSSTRDFCPNYWESVRRRPDAPATSPYPEDCDANPYALGAVYGIQAGYGNPISDENEVKIKPGTYTATVTINQRYRELFAIPTVDASTTIKVTVVKGRDQGPVRPHRLDDLRTRSQVGPPTDLKSSKAVKPSGPLPDLRSVPAWGIEVEKGRYLNFSATVWNAGPSPMVVDGFRRPNNENLMDAYQYFFNATGGQVGYARVGTMEWDARDGHEHWHFTDFASYRLLDNKKKLVKRSQKEAFCLANTDQVDYTVPAANWLPENTDLHTSCGSRQSVGVREVLDAGSGDTYDQSLPGQSFDLKGLKNGVYYIEVLANPDRKLVETSTTNNVSYRKVTISGKSGHRKAAVAKVGIIVEPPIESDDLEP